MDIVLENLLYLFRGNRSTGTLDGEDTSRDSETSPNYATQDRTRITGRFDPDETEAANMLGKQKI